MINFEENDKDYYLISILAWDFTTGNRLNRIQVNGSKLQINTLNFKWPLVLLNIVDWTKSDPNKLPPFTAEDDYDIGTHLPGNRF